MDARARHALLARLSLAIFSQAWGVDPHAILTANRSSQLTSRRVAIAQAARVIWLASLVSVLPLKTLARALPTVHSADVRTLRRARDEVAAWAAADERIGAALDTASETIEALNAFLSMALETPAKVAATFYVREREARAPARAAADPHARLRALAREMRQAGREGAAEAIERTLAPPPARSMRLQSVGWLPNAI